MTQPPSPQALLSGRRVLIVEDRYIVASELAQDVRGLGGEVVGPCGDLESAIRHAQSKIDIALLDVNLNGVAVFPAAEALSQAGARIVFLTGYDSELLPEAWRDRPRLSKPVNARALREAMAKL